MNILRWNSCFFSVLFYTRTDGDHVFGMKIHEKWWFFGMHNDRSRTAIFSTKMNDFQPQKWLNILCIQHESTISTAIDDALQHIKWMCLFTQTEMENSFLAMTCIDLIEKMHRKTLFSIYLYVHRSLIKQCVFYVVKIDGERNLVWFVKKTMRVIDENSCLSEEKERSPLQLMMS